MKRTHRAIAFIALIAMLISLMSCSLFSIFEKNSEDTLYRNAIDDYQKDPENYDYAKYLKELEKVKASTKKDLKDTNII